MAPTSPFQLLEINIISAQDLHPVSKNMRTYATAWVRPNRKLTTRVVKEGHNNPTWNDKFVFRVDDAFLRSDTSAVMIEIYSLHWFRDSLVGTVRVLVGNLIPPPPRPHQRHRNHHMGMRFFALQVRRPSGRPQGILNIGVTVLDSSMRSMPLYTQLSASAVGFNDFMGEENNHHNATTADNAPPQLQLGKPLLRRSRSERSDRIAYDDLSTTNGSLVAVAQRKPVPGKSSSILSGSGSDGGDPVQLPGKTKKKASSVISGAELRERPKEKDKKGKASSLISGSSSFFSNPKNQAQPKAQLRKETRSPSSVHNDPPTPSEKLGSEIGEPPSDKAAAEKQSGSGNKAPLITPPAKMNGLDLKNGKFVLGGPGKANSIFSDSEVGPSPSEVAAAKATERYPLDDNNSSVLDGWSLDESVEGLRSKLDRWRTEFPPLYDRGFSSSFRSTSQHVRRHSEGGSGLFSCFGNIYGYECQCICGKPSHAKRGPNGRFHSPSHSEGRSLF